MRPWDRRNLIDPAELQRLSHAARRLALRAGYSTGVLHALNCLRPAKHRGLLILVYHSVGANDLLHRGLRVSASHFSRQLDYATRHFEILSLERAVEMMKRGEPLPENAAALTFDDGFRDNYETAFPLLKKRGCPATVFVATEPLTKKTSLWPYKLLFWIKNSPASRLEFSPGELPGTGRIAFDLRTKRRRRRALYAIEAALSRVSRRERERLLAGIAEKLGLALDDDPFEELQMLTWEQLREMAEGGMTIGSHTLSHPTLPALSRDDARREIAESKAVLEAELKRPVKLFAYPFGGFEHFSPEIQALVNEAGYEGACTTIGGVNLPGANPLALRRVAVQDDPPAVFAFKLSRLI
jgi:peptidoglycan/xylan/chitin deacetylase (PgdA/CDA1 family)